MALATFKHGRMSVDEETGSLELTKTDRRPSLFAHRAKGTGVLTLSFKIGLPKIILYWFINASISGFLCMIIFFFTCDFTRDFYPFYFPASRAVYPRPVLFTHDPLRLDTFHV